MRAAEAERHAEALGVADHDVGAPFARRLEQGEREQVGGHRDQAAARVHGLRHRRVVADVAPGVWVLQQDTETVDRSRVRGRAHHQLDAEAVGAGAHHLQGLRVDVVGDEERSTSPSTRAGRGPWPRRRGGLVQQRGVGDVHAGEVGAHLLVTSAPSGPGDLRLIRGGRCTGGVSRCCAGSPAIAGAVVALADEAAEDVVPARDRADRASASSSDCGAGGSSPSPDLMLAGDGGGHRLRRVVTDDFEHARDLGVVGADVALDEGVVLLSSRRLGLDMAGHLGSGTRDRARLAQAVLCGGALCPSA